MLLPGIVAQIATKLRQVDANPHLQRVLSKSELMAVLLVKNDCKELAACNFTVLDAVKRLGPDWVEACHYLQRNGWRDGAVVPE